MSQHETCQRINRISTTSEMTFNPYLRATMLWRGRMVQCAQAPEGTAKFRVITIEEIEAARTLLAGVTVNTPLLPSDRLSQDAGCQVYVKVENTQRAGSFKLRGAYTR